jgi:ABC-type antimicrobial peptide transport system permease subunit
MSCGFIVVVIIIIVISVISDVLKRMDHCHTHTHADDRVIIDGNKA